MSEAKSEVWCEGCGSKTAGAHFAGCTAEVTVDRKCPDCGVSEGNLHHSHCPSQNKVVKITPEPEPKKKPSRSRMSLSIRFTDDDAEIDLMKALSHVMDYCIKRGSLNQRQIDRIGNWFIDKYMDEIKWP